MISSRAGLQRGRTLSPAGATGPIRSRRSGPGARARRCSSGLKSSIRGRGSAKTSMRIERIEIFVTDLTTRLQRQRSTGAYDTGAPGALIGKPVLVKLFAEGIVGYGQIRPLAPHHSMPDTYAEMISMIRDVCGSRLIGQRVFDVEAIHAMFERISPANYMTRAVIDCALYDAMGKATGRPVYDLIGGLAQPLIPLEWSISMADDRGKMVADAERALHE